MTRRPRRTILATFHAMVGVQTIGSIDGQHKLPAPRQFVVHAVVWGVLFVVADISEELGRLAARLSVLILLTAAVIGPFGATVVNFMSMIAQKFAVTPPDTGASPQTQQSPGTPLTFA